MSRPRPISGSAGSRIRVILGKTGDDYLYYINEDDGNCEWQSRDWTVDDGGPPYGLCRQMNNINSKGRYITDVTFDSTGQWYVAGQKRDGTGGHSWWGDTDAGESIKNACDTTKVVFGNDDGNYHKEKRWVVLNGRNGYSTSQGIDSNLKSRMQRINKKRKTIDFIRLFDNNNFFISDSEGTQWSVGSHLSKELKDGGTVLDVTLADDGSWLVIRPNHYVASIGVSDKLTKKLRRFYREHKARQTKRSNEIKLHDEKIIRKEKERKAEQRRQEEERQRKEREEARKAEEILLRKAKEMSFKKKSDEVEFLRQIHLKRLRPKGKITAIGFSSKPGDAIVSRIIGNESIEVMKPSKPQAGTVIFKDPRLLTTFNPDEDSKVLMLLCNASDKFEADIALYYCECHNGICRCTKLLSGSFLPQSLLNSTDMKLLTHSPLRLVTDEPINGPTIFNEYLCREKINLRRLQEIVKDLETDTNKRAKMLQSFKQQQIGNGKEPPGLKLLQRCHAFEQVAIALATRLMDCPMDDNGHVTYEVG